MKKLNKVLLLMMLVLSACVKNEGPVADGYISAVMEGDQTKTTVTDEGRFTWSSGDNVWLGTTSGGITGTLSAGAGTSKAEFAYGTFFGELTDKAVYPYNAGHAIKGNELSVVLPASYDLGTSLSNTNIVMYGVNIGGTFQFSHLAGVMRFKFKNVPAGTDRFQITLDKKVNGTFVVDLDTDQPVVEAGTETDEADKTITLNFTPLQTVLDISLYVPLPVGTYASIALDLWAGDQSVWTYSNTVTNTINRKTLKLMPTITLGGTVGGDIADKHNKIYIGPEGSDDNDGCSIDTPIATIAKAREILSADGELVFLDGDYENLELDLSDFAVISAAGSNARLMYPRVKITKATSVSGKISCADIPSSLKSFTANIWQQDVADADTEIQVSDRSPLQQGRTHRLLNTRIYNVLDFDTSSTDLNGYLATMESSDLYMYYLDASAKKLYFSSPSYDFSSHPIMIPSSKIIKGSSNRTIDISGLTFYYATLLTSGLNGNISDVFVGYTAGAGCIRWDYTDDMTFYGCEVAAGKNDGFNGHYSGSVRCFNCWGHDCSDDGESCHEACRIVQYGGLYEYNGNACTPASGGSGEYNNVTASNNGDFPWVIDKAGTGFSAQGVAAYISCNNCLSINNRIGYRITGTDTYGVATNCVSQNDIVAFSKIDQYNCTIIKE